MIIHGSELKSSCKEGDEEKDGASDRNGEDCKCGKGKVKRDEEDEKYEEEEEEGRKRRAKKGNKEEKGNEAEEEVN